MRGKLVVVLFIVGAIGFSAYAFWFFFNLSPVDQRFNQNRLDIPDQNHAGDLLVPKVDDFIQTGGVVLSETGPSSSVYTNNNAHVQFSATFIKDQAASQAAKTALVKPTCKSGDPDVTTHLDAKQPYSYTICGSSDLIGGSDPTYIFEWINGNWLFTANGTDPEVLLRFANLYIY
jgi:hypothetical protein